MGGVEGRLTEEETPRGPEAAARNQAKASPGQQTAEPAPGPPGSGGLRSAAAASSMRRPLTAGQGEHGPASASSFRFHLPAPLRRSRPLCEADARACCSRAAANADLGVGGQWAGLGPPCLLSPGSTHEGRRPSLPLCQSREVRLERGLRGVFTPQLYCFPERLNSVKGQRKCADCAQYCVGANTPNSTRNWRKYSVSIRKPRSNSGKKSLTSKKISACILWLPFCLIH